MLDGKAVSIKKVNGEAVVEFRKAE